jgi:hypothetical protein
LSLTPSLPFFSVLPSQSPSLTRPFFSQASLIAAEADSIIAGATTIARTATIPIAKYIEAQAPPARTLEGGGKVGLVRMFDSSAGKACTATLQLKGPNNLRLQVGTDIDLWAQMNIFVPYLLCQK